MRASLRPRVLPAGAPFHLGITPMLFEAHRQAVRPLWSLHLGLDKDGQRQLSGTSGSSAQICLPEPTRPSANREPGEPAKTRFWAPLSLQHTWGPALFLLMFY